MSLMRPALCTGAATRISGSSWASIAAWSAVEDGEPKVFAALGQAAELASMSSSSVVAGSDWIARSRSSVPSGSTMTLSGFNASTAPESCVTSTTVVVRRRRVFRRLLGDVVAEQLLVGEQAGGENRERGVLVRGGANGARVDDYLVHFDRNQERLIMLDSPEGGQVRRTAGSLLVEIL